MALGLAGSADTLGYDRMQRPDLSYRFAAHLRGPEFLILLVLAVNVTGCATSPSLGAIPEAFPRSGSRARVAPLPGMPTAIPEPAVVAARPAPLAPADTVAAVLTTARRLTGVRYVLGGSNPSQGFDCSGLVRYVLQQHGIDMPRTTAEQFDRGPAVDRPQTSPGDLIFFSTTGPGATHVGIVLDEHQFIHAPGTGSVVRVERFDTPYWSSRFLGTRRPLAAGRQPQA